MCSFAFRRFIIQVQRCTGLALLFQEERLFSCAVQNLKQSLRQFLTSIVLLYGCLYLGRRIYSTHLTAASLKSAITILTSGASCISVHSLYRKSSSKTGKNTSRITATIQTTDFLRVSALDACISALAMITKSAQSVSRATAGKLRLSMKNAMKLNRAK